jgi:hypothetical protein
MLDCLIAFSTILLSKIHVSFWTMLGFSSISSKINMSNTALTAQTAGISNHRYEQQHSTDLSPTAPQTDYGRFPSPQHSLMISSSIEPCRHHVALSNHYYSSFCISASQTAYRNTSCQQGALILVTIVRPGLLKVALL